MERSHCDDLGGALGGWSDPTSHLGIDTHLETHVAAVVEMIRALRVARRGAMKARVAAAKQLYGVGSSAPKELRQPLLGLKTKA
jgi:hypothetical protein